MYNIHCFSSSRGSLTVQLDQIEAVAKRERTKRLSIR